MAGDAVGRGDFYYLRNGGGGSLPAYPSPVSGRHAGVPVPVHGIDSIFADKLHRYPDMYMAAVGFPGNDSDAYTISVYPHKRYYDADRFYYDPYSLSEIPVSFYGRFRAANGGEKLNRMNYDIHIGNILGLPGRMAMFFAVLIGASLPVTGFYIWRGKRSKNKGRAPARPWKVL